MLKERRNDGEKASEKKILDYHPKLVEVVPAAA